MHWYTISKHTPPASAILSTALSTTQAAIYRNSLVHYEQTRSIYRNALVHYEQMRSIYRNALVHHELTHPTSERHDVYAAVNQRGVAEIEGHGVAAQVESESKS